MTLRASGQGETGQGERLPSVSERTCVQASRGSHPTILMLPRAFFRVSVGSCSAMGPGLHTSRRSSVSPPSGQLRPRYARTGPPGQPPPRIATVAHAVLASTGEQWGCTGLLLWTPIAAEVLLPRHIRALPITRASEIAFVTLTRQSRDSLPPFGIAVRCCVGGGREGA